MKSVFIHGQHLKSIGVLAAAFGTTVFALPALSCGDNLFFIGTHWYMLDTIACLVSFVFEIYKKQKDIKVFKLCKETKHFIFEIKMFSLNSLPVSFLWSV